MTHTVRRVVFSSMLCIGLLGCGLALAKSPGDIVGTWLTSDEDGNRDSIVEIFQNEGRYFGEVRWVRFQHYPEGDRMAGHAIVDRENPDPALRSRSVLGLRILRDLQFDDDEWVDGRIYDVRKGKTYSAKVTLESADTLNVRGYIGSPFLGKTVKWTRAELPDAETPGSQTQKGPDNAGP